MKTELLQRLSEKCSRSKIDFEKIDKAHFLGAFVNNVHDFQFLRNERLKLYKAAELLKKGEGIEFDLAILAEIDESAKKIEFFFCDHDKNTTPITDNLLVKMQEAADKNVSRVKQGYRYNMDYKRFCVYNRIISGRMAFKTIHSNLKGCFPSISSIDRYIHRTDHAIVEGELRAEELLQYIKERKLPLWVSLSEDATRVENRIQYDSRTNQIIGFVLPTNQHGMPVSLCFKARTGHEILQHFSRNISVANFVNTIILWLSQ